MSLTVGSCAGAMMPKVSHSKHPASSIGYTSIVSFPFVATEDRTPLCLQGTSCLPRRWRRQQRRRSGERPHE